jgi:hypothetical protein
VWPFGRWGATVFSARVSPLTGDEPIWEVATIVHDRGVVRVKRPRPAVGRCRRIVAVCGVVVAVTAGLSGCAAVMSPFQTSVSSGAGEPQVVRPMNRAQVVAALPDAKDVGAGWRAVPSSTSKNSDKTTLKASPAKCQKLWNATDDDPSGSPVSNAKRDYRRSAHGPFVTVEVASYREAPTQLAYEELRSLISACPTFTLHGSTGTTTFRVKAIKLPQIGDGTEAFEMSGRISGVPFVVLGADAIVGTTDVSAFEVAIGTQLSPVVLERTLRATVTRVTRLTAG